MSTVLPTLRAVIIQSPGLEPDSVGRWGVGGVGCRRAVCAWEDAVLAFTFVLLVPLQRFIAVLYSLSYGFMHRTAGYWSRKGIPSFPGYPLLGSSPAYFFQQEYRGHTMQRFYKDARAKVCNLLLSKNRPWPRAEWEGKFTSALMNNFGCPLTQMGIRDSQKCYPIPVRNTFLRVPSNAMKRRKIATFHSFFQTFCHPFNFGSCENNVFDFKMIFNYRWS